eukprot:scaffold36267_cov112-Isochrysis_galbana.AAC.2
MVSGRRPFQHPVNVQRTTRQQDTQSERTSQTPGPDTRHNQRHLTPDTAEAVRESRSPAAAALPVAAQLGRCTCTRSACTACWARTLASERALARRALIASWLCEPSFLSARLILPESQSRAIRAGERSRGASSSDAGSAEPSLFREDRRPSTAPVAGTIQPPHQRRGRPCAHRLPPLFAPSREFETAAHAQGLPPAEISATL